MLEPASLEHDSVQQHRADRTSSMMSLHQAVSLPEAHGAGQRTPELQCAAARERQDSPVACRLDSSQNSTRRMLGGAYPIRNAC